MNNARIAATLEEIAVLLEIDGANPFRVRAYRNAARTMHDFGESIADLVEEQPDSLKQISGIGADLAEKIVALVKTGEIPMLKELLAKIPPSLLALLRIPGLGPKKASALHKQLGIKDLDDLREACNQHRVRELKGFGEKTEQAILAGLEIAGQADLRIYWADADSLVQAILQHLSTVKGVIKLAAAGSYRRGKETVGDLDFLAVTTDVDSVMDRLGSFEDVESVLARGDTKMSVRLAEGVQVDLRVVPEKSFGAALQYFTGSKDHNVILRGMAKDRGLKINEYGLYRGDELICGSQEEEIYAALDLPWIPPELREARKEFDWARANELPRLIELEDLQGDLHMHTTATDGNASLEEMAAAAQARGLRYIAITDHSKRVSMANGLNEKRLLEQWQAIDELNAKKPGIIILKGVEVDILEKGGLDILDEVLAQADWVMASVHYGQNQSKAQITGRILEAIENPNVSAISHPTGRLINRREAYEVDLPEVFAAARQHGKLMELNANPMRLDLDDVACATAKSYGIPIVISTDAHAVNDLNKMRYGILQARRAGLTREDVANTRTWMELKSLVGKKRKKA